MAVEEDPPFDPELHKWAVDDKMVECFMKGCNYQDSFSNVISHLRKGKILATIPNKNYFSAHNEHDAYLIYRHRLMSLYSIMQRRCENCTFQFMTERAYEAHHQLKKCQIYKSKSFSDFRMQ